MILSISLTPHVVRASRHMFRVSYSVPYINTLMINYLSGGSAEDDYGKLYVPKVPTLSLFYILHYNTITLLVYCLFTKFFRYAMLLVSLCMENYCPQKMKGRFCCLSYSVVGDARFGGHFSPFCSSLSSSSFHFIKSSNHIIIRIWTEGCLKPISTWTWIFLFLPVMAMCIDKWEGTQVTSRHFFINLGR